MSMPHHTDFRLLWTLWTSNFQIKLAQFTCKAVFHLDFITTSSVRASLNLKAKLLFLFIFLFSPAHAFSIKNEVFYDLISSLLQLVSVLSLIMASTCAILQKVREMRRLQTLGQILYGTGFPHLQQCDKIKTNFKTLEAAHEKVTTDN